MNLTDKIWPLLTCPNGHRASMAGCHTQGCQYTLLAPPHEVRTTGARTASSGAAAAAVIAVPEQRTETPL